jgi:hypothetical protein
MDKFVCSLYYSNPTIASTHLTKTSKTKLIRLFSTNSQMTKIANLELAAKRPYLEKWRFCSKILMLDDTVTKINITNFLMGSTEYPVLLLLTTDDMIGTVLASAQIGINQKVYFLSTVTKQVFETYTINNIKIVRKLGMFQTTNNGQVLIFSPEPGVETDFVKRRSDFQGVTLKAMVEKQTGTLSLHPNFKTMGTVFLCFVVVLIVVLVVHREEIMIQSRPCKYNLRFYIWPSI